MLDQLVVHEPRAVHRLNYRPHWSAIHGDAAGQAVQAVAVRRRREVIDQLPFTRDQADVDALATEVKTGVQHDSLLHRRAGIGPVHHVPWTVVGAPLFEWPAARALSARA